MGHIDVLIEWICFYSHRHATAGHFKAIAGLHNDTANRVWPYHQRSDHPGAYHVDLCRCLFAKVVWKENERQ